MKAVMLAAGKGNRLKIHGNVTNKCFVKVCNRPLLEYALDFINPSFFTELIIVVGYNAEYVINYIGTSFHGVKVSYIHQEHPRGIVDAIKFAYEAIACEEFLMMLSDEIIIDPRISHMIEYFNNGDFDGICGVTHESAERISVSYSLRTDDKNKILQVQEKPAMPFNSLCGTGLCIANRSLLELVFSTPVNNERNEYELCDWLQLGIDQKLRLQSFVVGSRSFNINTNADIIEAERYIRGKS